MFLRIETICMILRISGKQGKKEQKGIREKEQTIQGEQ
jgi:hypothetical protein